MPRIIKFPNEKWREWITIKTVDKMGDDYIVAYEGNRGLDSLPIPNTIENKRTIDYFRDRIGRKILHRGIGKEEYFGNLKDTAKFNPTRRDSYGFKDTSKEKSET
jgi:hypothetical protein